MRVKMPSRLWPLAVATALLTGCASLSNRYGEHRVQRYIRRNPDRPGIVLEALRRGDIVTGMTADEVRLLLGPPASTRPRPPDGTTWLYDQPGQPRGDIAGSSMWALRVPARRLVFDANDTLTLIDTYQRAAAAPPGAQTPPAADRAPPAPPPLPAHHDAPITTAPSRDLYAMATPEADTASWPDLTLNGVLTTAGRAGAVLNHTVIETGESVKGVTVVAIESGRVLLERNGVRIVLETGQSTRRPLDP